MEADNPDNKTILIVAFASFMFMIVSIFILKSYHGYTIQQRIEEMEMENDSNKKAATPEEKKKMSTVNETMDEMINSKSLK